MPSSKNYVRDYKQEAKTSNARGENKGDAERHKLRREAVKEGIVKPGDGKDDNTGNWYCNNKRIQDHNHSHKRGGADGKPQHQPWLSCPRFHRTA